MWRIGLKNNIQADLHSSLNRKKGQAEFPHRYDGEKGFYNGAHIQKHLHCPFSVKINL